ncbi:hypothetical protein Rhe02_54770 [Rhizocola hellebori]|uniref:Phage portal protein n=1 Tax=Rhizocola hellebori TaxID=1392758 RepID=A0A8J3QBA5_9ACTN|nr:phage portal protein [Rhizocola hellebori]GIH07410.1 hypothetical protein Rhe02_54770 [Rhizocola hellebori]
MDLLGRIAAKRNQLTGGQRPRGAARKSFTEPLSWALDEMRLPWLGSTPLDGRKEGIENDFEAYIRRAYKANGIIFACITTRQQVFSQARFQWREFTKGRPGDLFGNEELSILERPWPSGTTGELLARMEVVASLAGNFYATVVDDDGRFGKAATGEGRRIAYLRPDWVTIIIGSPNDNPYDARAKVIGYEFQPRTVTGVRSGQPLFLLPNQVCAYQPIPDPEARFRGMSWLTPVLREIQADNAATSHKDAFLKNSARPGLAIKMDKDTSTEAFKEFVEIFKANHQGWQNHFGTLFLAGGADVTPITMNFQELDLANVQAKTENRIAVAAGVPAAILGISEGLQGSTLNAGNFTAAKRLFAETTIADLWAKACPSLQTLLTPPSPGAELWYDARQIPFLRDDAKDAASIQQMEATTIKSLNETGYEPDSVVAAVINKDWRLLKHSGRFSVQLRAPGEGEEAAGQPTLPAADPSTTLALPSGPDEE